MTRKWWLRAGVAAAAALTLAGVTACSSSSNKSNTAADGGKVTISYGLWDKNQVPAANKQIADFEKSHPNITVKVELTPYTDYFTKLQAAATGGEAPDVFWMNGPNFQLYASNGVLAPLSGVTFDAGNYPDSLVKYYQYNGTQFGVPKDFDTIGLWYNKALFDKAKLAYPDSTWTWDTFHAAATKLTNKAAGVYGAASLLEGQEGYYNTIFQAGGYVVSPDGKTSGYNTPEAISGLSFWTDMIKNGSSPTLQQMTDTQPYQMFETGKVAMFWGGSWDAVEFGNNSYTARNADVAVLPSGKEKATVIHGLANVVFKRSKHLDAAKEFETYLASKQSADILGSTGTVIPAYNDTQTAWVAAHKQFHLQNFLDELPYSKPLPVSANTATWNTLESNLLPKAWSGSESVSDVAADLSKQMDDALSKESK